MSDNTLVGNQKKIENYRNYYFFDGKDVKSGKVMGEFNFSDARDFYIGFGHKAKILNSDYLVGQKQDEQIYPKMYNVSSYDMHYAVKESDLFAEFNDCVMDKITKTENYLMYLRGLIN